ncbi:hypothetical protein [Lysobacter sp.]|uniref:hypothetical protein n=1 Tax=Lysobacter sp. TaxID=72226 RepID=UPI002D56FD20|nr:hypothetical protein [Lysobacter sp.]HZX77147.1 hypothetical protein [Lysobacter sp.]
MQNYETIADALTVARQVLAGEIDPNLGCGLIATIGQKQRYPDELALFELLSHEQYGHEELGITVKSCVPDILEACRSLLATHA